MLNSINFISGWILPSPSDSATVIAYKGVKIVAILQHDKPVLGIFSLHMRRNSYLWASGQKSDPTIHSGDLDFL